MDNLKKLITELELSPHKLPGVLITCSGVDGSGKTTIVGKLKTYICERRVNCVDVKTPSKECRSLSYFQTYAKDQTSALRGECDLASLCLVCIGDNLMAMRTHLLPMLEKGAWILCDHYIYTDIVELFAIGCSPQDMKAVLGALTLFPAPDLAILADVPVDVSIRRVRERLSERDRPINLEIIEKRVEAYRWIAEQQGFAVVSTENSHDETFELLKPRIDALLQAQGLN